MEDATGKVGGKRALDDHGNWIHIKSFPKSIQIEISNNSKAADKARMESSLKGNQDYVDVQNEKKQVALEKENSELKDLVKSQGDMLAKINAKLELGAGMNTDKTPDAPKDDEGGDKPETPKPAKKLTEKQKVIMKAEKLGVDFDESETTKEIKAKIKLHESSEF